MKQHKYFRNLRYKQKLETDYNNCRYAGVWFLTADPDPRYARENQIFWWWPDKKQQGHDYYEYYARPEINYSIVEKVGYSWSNRRRKKYFKKYSNRIVRRSNDSFSHMQYKKQFDLQWELD